MNSELMRPRCLDGNQLVKKVQGARNEAGFQTADQKAQNVERGFTGDKHHGCRGDTPGNHDAGDPAFRTDLVQNHVARNFEQEIADEKDAGAEAVDGIAEAEIALHLQLGEADVDAVQIGEHKTDHQKGHEAQRDATIQFGFCILRDR